MAEIADQTTTKAPVVVNIYSISAQQNLSVTTTTAPAYASGVDTSATGEKHNADGSPKSDATTTITAPAGQGA